MVKKRPPYQVRRAAFYSEKIKVRPRSYRSHLQQRPLNIRSIKDVGIFLDVFDTPLPHVGILTLDLTSDALKFKPHSAVFYYCGWFDF